MFLTRYTKQFLIAALAIYIGTCALILSLGVPLGIDFTGGSLTEVSYETLPEKSQIEGELDILSLGTYSLRSTSGTEGRDGYILRMRDLSEEERKAVARALTNETQGGTIDRFTSVGPVIGEELKAKALYALGAVFLIIILYVAFVFRKVSKPVGSWVYGGITILVLLHDVLVPTAVVAVLGVTIGIEADVLFVMALLAVLGYSVNDTIVVFDRIRETKGKAPRLTGEMVNVSINQTLSRTLLTSITTLIVVVLLYAFGGDGIHAFAFALVIGVLVGTYSSIFIASPALLWLMNRPGSATARATQESEKQASVSNS